jgi:hypothetical protein
MPESSNIALAGESRRQFRNSLNRVPLFYRLSNAVSIPLEI